MDNTIIQEASASETMNGDATPECAADIPSDAAAATTDAAPVATETKSYDDLFPSLPTSGRNPAAGGPTNNAWNRKPVLASSTVTQVRYVNTMYMPRGEQCSCLRWDSNLELGLLLLLRTQNVHDAHIFETSDLFDVELHQLNQTNKLYAIGTPLQNPNQVGPIVFIGVSNPRGGTQGFRFRR